MGSGGTANAIGDLEGFRVVLGWLFLRTLCQRSKWQRLLKRLLPRLTSVVQWVGRRSAR